MYCDVLSITKIRELYFFLLGAEKTSYKEITDAFGIKNRQTIRKYLDMVEEVYNISVISEQGRYGGTHIYRPVEIIRLGNTEEKTLRILLVEDHNLTIEMKMSIYSILYRLAGTKETDMFLKEIHNSIFIGA